MNFHLPSKLALAKVTEPEYVNKPVDDDLGPHAVYRTFDPNTGRTWGHVVVHNLARGRFGIGGTRMVKDIPLSEIYRLASAMTLKNALAMLPVGGGKSGFDSDGSQLSAEDHILFMRLYADALMGFDGYEGCPEYVPGPDMNTNELDMQALYDRFAEGLGHRNHGRGGVGRPKQFGGIPLDEWALTAEGLFAALNALERDSDFTLAGQGAIVQGYGNVGRPIARLLYHAGVRVVGLSDLTGWVYRADGLDIPAMERHFDGFKPILGAIAREGSVPFDQSGYDASSLDQLLEMSADILVPAARPDAIHEGNVSNIQASIILGGANNPVTHGAMPLLHQRGKLFLTDFLVNAGGVIGATMEQLADMDLVYRAKFAGADSGRTFVVDRVRNIVSRNVSDVLHRLDIAGSGTFHGQALAIARERVVNEAFRSENWVGYEGTIVSA
ncbi:MAG TPA: Glu/Leu/Phe/Val dehydrogenase dimerization domain-containing protein [Candidatus Nanoarchaeia archaeon]|nr:Glu/Leu/Phe/Val dehydrogenase dimerization domain-containing protein [Candidatus Nanoarchaeia archaeon]